MIYMSHRDSTASPLVRRVYEQLLQEYGSARVFLDSNHRHADADFRATAAEYLQETVVMLICIDHHWATASDASGQAYLFQRDDDVRFEVEIGLESDDITLLPIVLNDAAMPAKDELPLSMRPLAGYHALRVRNTAEFDADFKKLQQRLWQYDIDQKRTARLQAENSLAPPTSRWGKIFGAQPITHVHDLSQVVVFGTALVIITAITLIVLIALSV